jgi:hypothetical protein
VALADAVADAAAAAAAAALPSGLAAELPGETADASAASQFSDTSTCFVGEPPVFSGGGTVLACARVTTQSDQDFWSPTTVDTTGLYPAPLSVEDASPYF